MQLSIHHNASYRTPLLYGIVTYMTTLDGTLCPSTATHSQFPITKMSTRPKCIHARPGLVVSFLLFFLFFTTSQCPSFRYRAFIALLYCVLQLHRPVSHAIHQYKSHFILRGVSCLEDSSIQVSLVSSG